MSIRNWFLAVILGSLCIISCACAAGGASGGVRTVGKVNMPRVFDKLDETTDLKQQLRQERLELEATLRQKRGREPASEVDA